MMFLSQKPYILLSLIVLFGSHVCRGFVPSHNRRSSLGTTFLRTSSNDLLNKPIVEDDTASLRRNVVDGDKDKRVRVTVERILPVSPSEARKAWLKLHWSGGGGLPIFVWSESEDGVDNGVTKKRVVFPLMMEETLHDECENDDGDAASTKVLRYEVTDPGLLKTQIAPGTHSAVVKFQPTETMTTTTKDNGCLMTWDVSFDALENRGLWEATTRSTISTVAENVKSSVAAPRLFTCRMKLPTSNPRTALDEFIAFVWRTGGGIPPIALTIPWGDWEKGDTKTRIIVPPGLRETIFSTLYDVSVDRRQGCEIRYKVDNPGLLTTFPVHTHTGRVRFMQMAREGEAGDIGADKVTKTDSVEMIWEVEVRPYPFCRTWIELMLSSLITTMSRNLRVRLAEPGATVPVAPPRGKGEPFTYVAKETWLGGVLESHLSDRRSTWEQTLSIFQPWTWGRSNDNREGDVAVWTEGHLPP